MTGVHRFPCAPALAVVASLSLAAFTITSCSSEEVEPPGDAPGDAPVAVIPSIPGMGPAAVVVPNSPAPAADNPNCCSCAVVYDQTFADPRLPCRFDYPVSWQSAVGDDGGMLSAIAGPPPQSCGTICPNGTPYMTVSYGTQYDSNADEMLRIWPMAMPIVGDARCGEGTVQFFSPPGADETGFLGGVKFYVQLDGKKYGGAATFTCGEPGGWLRLRDMFIESFRDNPASTFPDS